VVRRPLIDLFYQPQIVDDDDECGAVCGMRIGRRNRSTRRKPSPVQLCRPQIPHNLIWARTGAAAVGAVILVPDLFISLSFRIYASTTHHNFRRYLQLR
jgi:hypothetical protein